MWITRQRWEELYFIHFEGPADIVRRAMPSGLELDLWNGNAVLSLVPFRMTRVRFPFVPSIPILSELWEYNIRTYVRIGNKPGIYFFTLESDNPLATWVARTFFGLPYHNAKIKVQMNDRGLHLTSKRKQWHSELLVEKTSAPTTDRDFDIWATERYSLFNHRSGRIQRGDVKHLPWTLEPAKLIQWKGNFLDYVPGASVFHPRSASYSKVIDVSFEPFKWENSKK
jgi:uncharacterized protein YqjF (DUF2071 family)